MEPLTLRKRLGEVAHSLLEEERHSNNSLVVESIHRYLPCLPRRNQAGDSRHSRAP